MSAGDETPRPRTRRARRGFPARWAVLRAGIGYPFTMRRSPPELTIDDIPRPVLPEPNAVKSTAPAVVVRYRCGLVERMDWRELNRFTKTSGAGSMSANSSR